MLTAKRRFAIVKGCLVQNVGVECVFVGGRIPCAPGGPGRDGLECNRATVQSKVVVMVEMGA